MGLNDAGEMLEVAKAENLRLEQELAEMDLLLERTRTLLYKATGERDRARATAVRLEQELAEAENKIEARDAFSALHAFGQQEDALAEARRTKWICE